MKLETTVLTNEQSLSTSKVSYDMKITEKNLPLMFKLIVERLYRNKLGSMIREITSNCFDSHIEAKVDTPVVVELRKEVSGNYISFIDEGVGMSPKRIEKVYCELGESTKRDNNDEIGGYGIGGKTPLAYSKAFFIITRFDGIEYNYTVRMDRHAPKVELMSQVSTKKHNGTEVKVPLKESDIYTAENEITKQLFYFENIVFKGFSEDVNNNYKIFKGKSFIYRGDEYSNRMHVCLGKVAYPIDYSTLDLDEKDYKIPVAIRLEIGDAKTIPSREDLEYTDETKKLIKKKLEEVKTELKDILAKQYESVTTLKEYYDATEDFGTIKFDATTELHVSYMLSRNDIDYTNFAYNTLPNIPKKSKILKEFYHIKMYGKKVPVNSWDRNETEWNDGALSSLKDKENIFYVKKEFNRKIIKQSYLNNKYTRFYLATPKDIANDTVVNELMKTFGAVENTGSYDQPIFNTVMSKSKALPLFKKICKEVIEMFHELAKDYDEIDVPDAYIRARKANKLSEDILKIGFPMKTVRYSGRGRRVTMKQLNSFRGKIFYGNRDDECKLSSAHQLANAIISTNNNSGVQTIDQWNFPTKGMLFVQISQQNEKYMKLLNKKAFHIRDFYKVFISRKVDAIVEATHIIKNSKLFNNDVASAFRTEGFKHVDFEIANKIKLIKEYFDKMEDISDVAWCLDRDMFKELFGINIENVEDNFKYKEELDWLIKVSKNSEDKIRWINMPYEIDPNSEGHKNLILITQLAIDK